MPKSTKTRVVAYLRTSSHSNIGDGKDSYKRQLEACRQYASANNVALDTRGAFYDKGISGTTEVESRPEFAKLPAHVGVANISVILVEGRIAITTSETNTHHNRNSPQTPR